MTTENMTAAERLRATYDFSPLDHLFRYEFYIWDEAITRWLGEGLPVDWRERNYFQYDDQAMINTGVNLGWCEPAFLPYFEEKLISREGDHEIIQDGAGRIIKVYQGRRHGFMPTYLKHAVSNMADWEAVAPRLDPENSARWVGLAETVRAQRALADEKKNMLNQLIIGGYMYLRALCGPEDLMYLFVDDPQVIHAAMQGWLALADAALIKVQAETAIDEIYLAEDICYNHGLLISPDWMREFLLPYYQQLIGNARRRQIGKIHVHIDTDGDCRPAIPIYQEIGMTRMSPFEVASGCDVVEIARQYPDLIMSGGIDKRVLAAGKEAIEKHLQYIIPFMLERGGITQHVTMGYRMMSRLKIIVITGEGFAKLMESKFGVSYIMIRIV